MTFTGDQFATAIEEVSQQFFIGKDEEKNTTYRVLRVLFKNLIADARNARPLGTSFCEISKLARDYVGRGYVKDVSSMSHIPERLAEKLSGTRVRTSIDGVLVDFEFFGPAAENRRSSGPATDDKRLYLEFEYLALAPVATAAAPLDSGPVGTGPRIAPSRLFWGKNTDSHVLIGRDDELKALNAAWSGAEKKNVVSIVAWGGVGKTSLVAHWAATKLAQPDHGGIERYFDWSFYSQGTRLDGDPAGEDKASSSDLFIKDALEFFGETELATSNRGPWQKGERLAQLAAQYRTLLILDGLEPLQEAKNGELRDEALRTLLRGLAANSRGLCLVTTRQHLPELNAWRLTTSPEWDLHKLSKEAGRELLKKLGVKGTATECEQLSQAVKGHALTLTLLGKYLAEAHDGDIRKRDLVSLSEADYEETSGHAFRVMEAYQRWLERDDRRVELALLRILGLFDRPATPDCLAALREGPPITDLTDSLVPLSDAQWSLAVKRLAQLGLVEEQPCTPHRILGYSEEDAQTALEDGHRSLREPKPLSGGNRKRSIGPGSCLDTHPLIREYFGQQLRGKEAWPAAHGRLFEHLRASVPYWPEGLSGLQPLYQAVVHACEAGRHDEACEVYSSRINRSGFPSYAVQVLGALGADLAAARCFFITPWTRTAPGLTEQWQGWLLNQTASHLRGLGRLEQAREPMRMAIEFAVNLSFRYPAEARRNAAVSSANLSELDLALGDIQFAVREADRSVSFADQSAFDLERAFSRATHASALYHAGLVEQARQRFKEAEQILREWHPEHQLLYSMGGFHFCEFLQAEAERAAWRKLLEKGAVAHVAAPSDAPRVSSNRPGRFQDHAASQHYKEQLRAARRRASYELSIDAHNHVLLDIAHAHLTLGRDQLYLAILDSSVGTRSRELLSHFDAAIDQLRQSGEQIWLARGLLTRAWQRVVQGQTTDARADLAEAKQLAQRGPMPLVLADEHLHRARLFFREDLTAARDDLKHARALIEAHGYLRRTHELEDAEQVILA